VKEILTQGLIKLNNREPHNLFSHLNITGTGKSRIMIWVRNVVPIGHKTCKQIQVGKLEGKRPPVTPKYRWEDNIKMHNKK
jgi:hypothetical protein